jgi:sterol 14alpha-demethylase
MLLQHRKFAAGGLTIKQFRSYTEIIRKETEDYILKHWGESGELELLESLNEITLYTSTHCIQGPEVRSRFNKEFAALYTDLDKALGVVSFLYPWLPIPLHSRRDTARQTIERLYKEIIDQRRESPKSEDYSDLIHTLMNSKYPDGSPMTDEEIVGLCIGSLLAGQHTSNVTSTWLGCFLLSNKHILDRVIAEHDEVFPPSEEFKLDFDKWKTLEVMSNCLKETLRLRPPIIMVFRRAMIDWQYDKYVIPAGSNVIVSPALANRDPEVFANPDDFDPDRFTKARAEEKKVKYSYIPFSAGRHACIGEQFAHLQVSAIWTTILHHYKVELVSKNIEPDYTTMIVAPKPPVTIKYTRRH